VCVCWGGDPNASINTSLNKTIFICQALLNVVSLNIEDLHRMHDIAVMLEMLFISTICV